MLHLHRGTPYIYQGEELGMTNVPFDDISALRDIESLNHYAAAVNLLGHDPAAVLDALRAMGRDNARTPMQWSAEPGAGFTAGTPWIGVNPNHETVNAAAQVDDPGSIFAHYRRLIALRHPTPSSCTATSGCCCPTTRRSMRSLASSRAGPVVVANLSDEPVACDLSGDDARADEPARGGGIHCPRAVGGAGLPVDARLSATGRPGSPGCVRTEPVRAISTSSAPRWAAPDRCAASRRSASSPPMASPRATSPATSDSGICLRNSDSTNAMPMNGSRYQNTGASASA